METKIQTAIHKIKEYEIMNRYGDKEKCPYWDLKREKK